ncbi:MAG: hypothetical protein ACK52Z_09110 [Acidobacteriota bacterium]
MVRQAGTSACRSGSTKAARRKIQIGDLNPSHFQAVHTGRMPPPSLLAVQHDSLEYNGKHTEQFHNQSRGRTHMRMLGRANRKARASLLPQLVRGAPREGSFVHMNCSGASPILRFASASEKGLEIEMRTPKKINFAKALRGERLKLLDLLGSHQNRKVKLDCAKACAGR